jgi:hypothetical protein
MRDVLLEETEDVVAHALPLAARVTVFGRQAEGALEADASGRIFSIRCSVPAALPTCAPEWF